MKISFSLTYGLCVIALFAAARVSGYELFTDSTHRTVLPPGQRSNPAFFGSSYHGGK